jgi:hypothetical protein
MFSFGAGNYLLVLFQLAWEWLCNVLCQIIFNRPKIRVQQYHLGWAWCALTTEPPWTKLAMVPITNEYGSDGYDTQATTDSKTSRIKLNQAAGHKRPYFVIHDVSKSAQGWYPTLRPCCTVLKYDLWKMDYKRNYPLNLDFFETIRHIMKWDQYPKSLNQVTLETLDALFSTVSVWTREKPLSQTGVIWHLPHPLWCLEPVFPAKIVRDSTEYFTDPW